MRGYKSSVISEETSKRVSYIESLRCYAAFAVVVLHVICTPFVFCYDAYSDLEHFLVRLVRNLMSWGVPVFVMITGSLLLNPSKELPLHKLFFKYIRRFVLVIAIFVTCFSLMELVFTEKTFSASIFFKAILNTLAGKSWDHTWYLYMTIGLYALLPFLRCFTLGLEKMDDKSANQTLFCTLCVIFVGSSILPYQSFFFDFSNHFPEVSIYIFYALLGYAVHKWNFTLSNKVSWCILVGYILYTSLIQLDSRFLMKDNSALYTLGNESPIVLLSAFAIFSLSKNFFSNKNRKIGKLTKFLSPLTFGIYILHTVAVNMCYKVLKLTPENMPFLISFFATLFITLTFSIISTWILRKIPIVKKYLL